MKKIERLLVNAIGHKITASEVCDKLNSLIDAVNALIEIESSDEDLSGKINEGLDRVSPEDLLVPDEVEFVEYGSNGSIYGLLFSRQQILTFSEYDGYWFVTKYTEKQRRLRCKLVPCKLEDVAVGERFIDGYFINEGQVNESRCYYLKTGEDEMVCADGGVQVEDMHWVDQQVYKVQPID